MPLPNRRDQLSRTKSVLEREICELQVTTKEAIQQSWQEENELRRANSFKDRKITELEQKLASTNHQQNAEFPIVTSSKRTSGALPGNLDLNWNNEDEETSAVSSLEDANADPASSNTSITPSSSGIGLQETPRNSFPSMLSMKSFFNQKSTQEEALMRQMALMDQYHKQQVAELELKLKQREAAIATLEKSMSVQIGTVDFIRNQMESVEAKNQDLQKELDAKSNVIVEMGQRVGIEDFPMARLPKRNTMGGSSHSSLSRRGPKSNDGSLNSRSAHVRGTKRFSVM